MCIFANIFLRFDGVYSHAFLYVNGKEVREHHGGFTRWETDITSYVRPGKKAEILLRVEDRLDDISYASGYAHHPIGGILRDVTLFALPASYLYDIAVETELDSLYQHARLHFCGHFAGADPVQLHLRLKDANGITVGEHTCSLRTGRHLSTLDVQSPQKWDAEHPYLYTLEVCLKSNGKELVRFNRMVGFRKIEVVKDQLLVNGSPVKLSHQKGCLQLPACEWMEGEHVEVAFQTAQGELIDKYRLTLGEESIHYPDLADSRSLRIEENSEYLVICGNGFEIPFNKADGLITRAKAGNEVLIAKGPFLHLYVNLNHLSGAEVRKTANHIKVDGQEWRLSTFHYRKVGSDVLVTTTGTYNKVRMRMDFRITPRGELSVTYNAEGMPNGFLRESGLTFELSDNVQELEWKRKGYWDNYPAEAMAGNEGHVSLYNSRQAGYGEKPVQPWADDTHNYYYWADAGANCRRPLTQGAKGRKEHIYYYTLSFGNPGVHQLAVVSSTASVACQLQKRKDERIYLHADNRWDYPEIAWGNYCKKLEALPCYGTIQLNLK